KLAIADLRKRVIISVGRLTAAKCLDMIIAAVAADTALRQEVTLLLVGSGPEEALLIKQAADAGVDARFLGPIHDGAALGSLYAAADICVIPGAAGLGVIQSL